MHGPTCILFIFWANLTPFSLQRDAALVPVAYLATEDVMSGVRQVRWGAALTLASRHDAIVF
jgi:hypothetical protein